VSPILKTISPKTSGPHCVTVLFGSSAERSKWKTTCLASK
jgi:hypothetical protein